MLIFIKYMPLPLSYRYRFKERRESLLENIDGQQETKPTGEENP